MFVKLLRDQNGIISILEVIEKKENINLKNGDVVKRIDDLEKYKKELEKQNTERKRYLLALSKKTLEKVIQNKRLNINLNAIKSEHYEIIKNYKKNPSDAAMGNIIMLHNKNGWTDELICCGESKYKINKFINELQLEVGEFTEA